MGCGSLQKDRGCQQTITIPVSITLHNIFYNAEPISLIDNDIQELSATLEFEFWLGKASLSAGLWLHLPPLPTEFSLFSLYVFHVLHLTNMSTVCAHGVCVCMPRACVCQVCVCVCVPSVSMCVCAENSPGPRNTIQYAYLLCSSNCCWIKLDSIAASSSPSPAYLHTETKNKNWMYSVQFTITKHAFQLENVLQWNLS